MPDQQPPTSLQAAIASLRELTGAVDTLADRCARLTKANAVLARANARNRRLAVCCLVLATVLAVVVVGVVVALAGVHRNDATITDIHSTDITSCQDGNQTRADEVGLWDYIYRLSDVSKAPPAIRREDNELIAHIEKVFAPRNCAAEYRIP